MRTVIISSLLLIGASCPVPPPQPPTTTTTTIITPPTTIPSPPLCVRKIDPTSNCASGTSHYHNQVNQILSFVTGCNINSDCPLSDWQSTLVATMSSLNKSGLCATYDLKGCNDSQPGNTCGPGEGELGVRGLGDNFTDYYQPITTSSKVRWADALSICVPVWDSNTVDEVKIAFQGPVSQPQCPVKVEGDYFAQIQISSIGGNPQLYTATAKYCGFPVRSDVFPNCGTKCCTLGVDGGNEDAIICEQQLSGTPQWIGTGDLQLIQQDNPYNIKVASGHGVLKACGKSGCSNEIEF